METQEIKKMLKNTYQDIMTNYLERYRFFTKNERLFIYTQIKCEKDAANNIIEYIQPTEHNDRYHITCSIKQFRNAIK